MTPTVVPSDPDRVWASPAFAASANLVGAAHDVDGTGDSVGTVLDTTGGFTLAVDELVL